MLGDLARLRECPANADERFRWLVQLYWVTDARTADQRHAAGSPDIGAWPFVPLAQDETEPPSPCRSAK